jgi:hypothetical protein
MALMIGIYVEREIWRFVSYGRQELSSMGCSWSLRFFSERPRINVK